MSSSPRSNVLSERSTNIPQSPEKSSKNGFRNDGKLQLQDAQQPKSLEYHRQEFEARLKENKNQQTYVSPSDNIQSPATAKLAAFKNRHIKSIKPRTLFGKTVANNAEVAAQQSTGQEKREQS